MVTGGFRDKGGGLGIRERSDVNKVYSFNMLESGLHAHSDNNRDCICNV